MAWTEGHLALVLTAITVARSEFFDALCAEALRHDQSNDKAQQNLKDLFTPQVLVLCETIYSLSHKGFSDPEKLRAFIENHNIDMTKERKFYRGYTQQGVSQDRYGKAKFGKRAMTGALYHWKDQDFRCDISFLQKVLGPLMSPKTCADTIELLANNGYLFIEPAGSSNVITSAGVFEPMVEAYLDKILEYGAMAKCIKSKKH